MQMMNSWELVVGYLRFSPTAAFEDNNVDALFNCLHFQAKYNENKWELGTLNGYRN